jgi:hypothetical protein
VRSCVQQAQRILRLLVCFRSVHAAALQPHCVARWLERAVRLLPADQCAHLAQIASVLLSPRHPAAGQNYTGEAPANVTAEEWREGSVQLQQEVSCNRPIGGSIEGRTVVYVLVGCGGASPIAPLIIVRPLECHPPHTSGHNSLCNQRKMRVTLARQSSSPF